MLPRITHHGIHAALDGRYLLIIIHIEIEQQITAKAVPSRSLTDILESGIQGCLWRTGYIETFPRTLGHIITEIQVSTEFLEPMNLVIHLEITQTALGRTLVLVLFQHGQGIDTGQSIRIISSLIPAHTDCFPCPVAVVSATIVIDRFGRVKEGGSAYGFTLCKAGFIDGSLYIQVDRQVVIQEPWAEIDGSRITVIVGRI